MMESMLAFKHKIAAVLGVVTGAILGWPPVFIALLIFMSADIVTGWIKAFVTRTLSSSASWEGGVKKIGVLVLIVVFHVVDNKNLLDGVGMEKIDVAPLLCGYYCFTEIISIIENLHSANIPLPSIILKISTRLKRQLSDDEQEGPNTSIKVNSAKNL